jgi:hypothetical protein
MSAADSTSDGRSPGRFMSVRQTAGSSGLARFLRRDHTQHLPLHLADHDMERGGLRLAVERRLDRAAGRLGLLGGDDMTGMQRPRHRPAQEGGTGASPGTRRYRSCGSGVVDDAGQRDLREDHRYPAS